MKKFETPEIEIEKLEIADVITTSNCDDYTPLEDETGDLL